MKFLPLRQLETETEQEELINGIQKDLRKGRNGTTGKVPKMLVEKVGLSCWNVRRSLSSTPI